MMNFRSKILISSSGLPPISINGPLKNSAKRTIVVMYDWLRGEPRGKIKKDAVVEDKGDCIDCKLCVHVCPTGIDIRNGTQLECVNCTACMDACDDVMVKVGRPKGLIRYSSHTRIKEGIKKLFTPRVIAYSIVLSLLIGILSILITSRSDIEASIHRVPGMSYLKNEDGSYSNLYNMRFLNKTFEPYSLEVKLENIATGKIEQVANNEIILGEGEMMEGVFKITIPRSAMKTGKNEVEIGIYRGGIKIDEIETNFMSPMPGKKL